MPEAHPIAAAETSVTALLGAATRGASYRPRRVTSLTEFTSVFGALRSDLELGYAVGFYFQNGGRAVWIVRVPQRPTLAQWDRGLRALDAIPALNVIGLPGFAETVVATRAISYAVTRRAFVVLDSPRNVSSAGGMLQIAASYPPSADAAVYYPWLVVSDPSKQGQERWSAPSGAIAGIFARTDETRGVWKSPAGEDSAIVGALRLATPVSESDGALLNPAAVNCLRSFPPQRILVWGARTLAGAAAGGSDWKYVPVRRLGLLLQQSIEAGLKWTSPEPNQEPLWAAVRGSIETFLTTLFRRGAFVGRVPQESFFVRCDRSTMTAADIAAGRLLILVGFAPLKPAEFVLLRFTQMVRAGT